MLQVQIVEALGGLVDVDEQFVLRDAGSALRPCNRLRRRVERDVREFRDDVEPVVGDPEILGGEQVRMAKVLDEFEGAEFALGDVLVGGLMQNFDGFLDAARHLAGEPDFAEGAAAEFADQSRTAGRWRRRRRRGRY